MFLKKRMKLLEVSNPNVPAISLTFISVITRRLFASAIMRGCMYAWRLTPNEE